MWTRRAFAGLVAGGVAASKAGAQVAASTRRDEIEALRRFAEATHPEGAAARLDPRWREACAALAARADHLGEGGYVVECLRLLSYFKDGHTALIAYAYAKGPWGLRLPVITEVFADGLYVVGAKDEATPLLGARLTRIAGTPTEALIRRLAEVWPSKNLSWPHRWTPLLLRTPGFLHGFGLLAGPDDAPVEVQGAFADGRSVEATMAPRVDGHLGRVRMSRPLSPLEAFAATQSPAVSVNGDDGRNFVWTRENGRLVYVSLDRMDDDDYGKPFASFASEVDAALDQPRAERVIIDLRRNGGGDNMLAEPLRHRIQRSRFNRPGGLYVLISPHTFSAAQNLANRLERETFAVFVGEPSGLAPNHFGDGKPFDGPSKLPIYVSSLRWQDMPPIDARIWTMPDIVTPAIFADYAAGRDVALAAAMSHRDARRLDDGVLTEPWSRASQALAWKLFWA